MPALSYHFGLTPADVWNLTTEEYAAYGKALDDLERASNG